MHPADLDDALCVGALGAQGGESEGGTRLPFAVDEALLQSSVGELRAVRRWQLFWQYVSFADISSRCWQVMTQQSAEVMAVRLEHAAEQLQAELDGFRSRALRAEAPAQRHLYTTEWRLLDSAALATVNALVLSGIVAPILAKRACARDMHEDTKLCDGAQAVLWTPVATQRARSSTSCVYGLEEALALVQVLVAATASEVLMLMVMATCSRSGSEHAGSRGLGRSARAEASLPVHCIEATVPAALMWGVAFIEHETLRQRSAVRAPRLKAATACFHGLMRLHFHARGTIANLYLEPQPAIVLTQEATVVLRVRAVGLNFRDVLNVLGEYPGDPGPPGGDVAGRIHKADDAPLLTSVDAAFGLAHAPLAGEAFASAQLLARKPAALTFEEACTLPVTWSTTHVALERAQVQAGCAMVLQAVAGGVGLKAFEYTRWLSASCTGTAGRPHKHAQLREVGASGLCSSRSGGGFAVGSAQLIGGGRYHAALNSLSLDFIAATFGSLGEGGAFEEIGKRSV